MGRSTGTGLRGCPGAGFVEMNRSDATPNTRLTEVEQAFEARIAIETVLLIRLAARMTPDVAAHLQGILRAEGAAYDEGELTEARTHARHFHVEVGRLAGNEFLSRFLEELIHRQPMLHPSRDGRRSEFSGHNLHIKTLAALSRGDGEEAAHYNKNLLTALRSEILRDIQAEEHQEEHSRP